MTILHLILIMALAYPLLLILDCRALAKADKDSQRASDSLTLVTPVALLYYHEAFWHNLIFYFIPLYLYFLLLAWIAQKKFRLESAVVMLLVLMGGSFVLSTIGYFMFFHEGSLAAEKEVVETVVETPTSLWVWWPIAAGVVLAIIATTIFKFRKNTEALLIPIALVFLTLPFFSHHPYWAMLLNTVLFLYSMGVAAEKSGSGAGAYSAFFFFYLLAQFGALIVYAVLF
jgi:hypothetical protein